jgi:hypothetical protein
MPPKHAYSSAPQHSSTPSTRSPSRRSSPSWSRCGVFAILGITAIVTAITTALYATETKQRTLEDISP